MKRIFSLEYVAIIMDVMNFDRLATYPITLSTIGVG